jgi:hypothetical protein
MNDSNENIEVEHTQKFQYQMLSRLQMDCDYFLGHGNRVVKHLYYPSVEEHITEMKKIWEVLKDKPEWLTAQQMTDYESNMKNLK